MKSESDIFLDIMDRLYSVGTAHHGSVMAPSEAEPWQAFWRFRDGKLAHIMINKDGLNYVRFVPSPSVQWLFDAYA